MLHEPGKSFRFVVSEQDQGVRLDLFLASRSIGLSRAKAQALIREGLASVDDRAVKANYRLRVGDKVGVSIPPAAPAEALEPESVDFTVVYEDASLIVLNKPPGVVVHPAPGHSSGTLVHGLIFHCKDLAGIGGKLRPGIVHRIDKDTSGLMVVAKNDHTHEALARQFKAGKVKKRYLAVVHGRLRGKQGKIDLPIARHPKKRKEMSVAHSGGRGALSIWQKIEDFEIGFSLLSISIKTGRTHQIRVHLSHIGHPVVGDTVYGYGENWWKRYPSLQRDAFSCVKRQMLHAECLAFQHPECCRYCEFQAAPPEDMENFLLMLRKSDSGTFRRPGP